MIALIAAVKADPQFAYTVGHHQPLVYTHHAAPVVYTHHAPVVYTPGNVCKNEAGAVVPCAHPAGLVGSGVYAYNHAAYGYVQPVVATAEATPEEAAPAEEAVVDVSKREAEAEAEADPESLYFGYYGYPGYAYGYHPYHSAYSYYGLPYTYGYGYYSPYVYGGCRNGYGALVPCAK